MKLKKFLEDKIISLIIYLISYFIISLLLIAFKINTSLYIVISLIYFIMGLSIILIEFFRKKNFYDEFILNLKLLDKKYLILETISNPNFYEGEILFQALYDINKSMCENIKNYEIQVNDFKEYIEMWIHEVKLPISSIILMCHNKKESAIFEQAKRIENYVEQVLYYVRSENAEKDYLIKEIELKKVINNVALKNKDDLLANKIEFIAPSISFKVYSDAKWLEFILNQIINNSIKYRSLKRQSLIKIDIKEENNQTIIEIYDNGLGIPSSDLPQVFNKTFTGSNGHNHTKSTGMGLFIAKNLCQKLGHKIEIESIKDKYTKVRIIINKNAFYDVVK